MHSLCSLQHFQLNGSSMQVLMHAVGALAYLPIIRDHVIQAQYLKAPFNLAGYVEHCPFLPDLNNEHNNAIKQQYRQNLLALDALVLVKFESDITGARRLHRPDCICACNKLQTFLKLQKRALL
jgi:hypothetical protein